MHSTCYLIIYSIQHTDIPVYVDNNILPWLRIVPIRTHRRSAKRVERKKPQSPADIVKHEIRAIHDNTCQQIKRHNRI